MTQVKVPLEKLRAMKPTIGNPTTRSAPVVGAPVARSVTVDDGNESIEGATSNMTPAYYADGVSWIQPDWNRSETGDHSSWAEPHSGYDEWS